MVIPVGQEESEESKVKGRQGPGTLYFVLYIHMHLCEVHMHVCMQMYVLICMLGEGGSGQHYHPHSGL